jgi:hypothetical protein
MKPYLKMKRNHLVCQLRLERSVIDFAVMS